MSWSISTLTTPPHQPRGQQTFLVQMPRGRANVMWQMAGGWALRKCRIPSYCIIESSCSFRVIQGQIDPERLALDYFCADISNSFQAK